MHTRYNPDLSAINAAVASFNQFLAHQVDRAAKQAGIEQGRLDTPNLDADCCGSSVRFDAASLGLAIGDCKERGFAR